MISLFPCWKKAPAPCRYSWPTLVINSSWFDNMLGGLSGRAKAQHCIAPHCPIGFTLQLGLGKSQRDQDPTFSLSLFFSHSLSHSRTRICFPPFFGLCSHTLLEVGKADLQIQPVKRRNTSCYWISTAVVFVSWWHVGACFPLLSKTVGLSAPQLPRSKA